MFKNNDEALLELKCHDYCLEQARKHFCKNNFMDAAIYLENAARSLKTLERMKTCNGSDKVLVVGTSLIGRNSGHRH